MDKIEQILNDLGQEYDAKKKQALMSVTDPEQKKQISSLLSEAESGKTDITVLMDRAKKILKVGMLTLFFTFSTCYAQDSTQVKPKPAKTKSDKLQVRLLAGGLVAFFIIYLEILYDKRK